MPPLRSRPVRAARDGRGAGGRRLLARQLAGAAAAALAREAGGRRSLARPLAAAAAAALAAACVGCGEPAPVAVDATPLRLTLSEYHVAPQAVRVPAGRLTIVVRNAGTTVHRLRIRGVDSTRTLAASPPLRPGESARVVVELAPGTYVDACALERHDTLGEHGTIEAR